MITSIDDLHALGRASLDGLVARLGYLGAGGVVMLLAAEMRLAGEGELVAAQPGATRSPPHE